MSPNDLVELLKVRPFEPFELTISTGERYTVRHPENLIVGRTKCYYPVFDGDLVDHLVHIALVHVVRAETVNGKKQGA